MLWKRFCRLKHIERNGQNMGNDVLTMLDELYAMVSEAWGVPLGNDKCIVERDKVLSALDEIKTSLPVEMSEARRLVSAKEEFIGNAKREADSIRKLAEERARHMVDEQEIVRTAQAESKKLLEDAERESNEAIVNAQNQSAALRHAAWQFVETSLRASEEAVSTALGTISAVRVKFSSAEAPEPVQYANETSEPLEVEEMTEIDEIDDDIIEE